MKILLLHILMVFGVVSVLDLGHSHKCVFFSYQVMSDLFVTPWTITCQDPLSVDFLGKNTGMGCHFLLQGNFPIEPASLVSLASAGRFFSIVPLGMPCNCRNLYI